jgi:tetratricopeptide (TPR) repeat protein
LTATLFSLGGLYHEQGRHTKEEPLMQRALDLHQSRSDYQPPDNLLAAGLGEISRDHGRTAEAERLFQTALEVTEEAAGTDHETVAPYLSQLGALYAGEGKLDEAESLIGRALRIYEEAEGVESRHIASVLSQLGSVYGRRGRYDEAGKLCERGVGILEPLVAQQPSDAGLATSLGWTYVQLGKANQGLDQATEADAAWVRSIELVGPFARDLIANDSFDTGLLDTYAQALLLLDRVEDARPVVEMLVRHGWNDEVFLDLCREHGLVLDSPAPNGPGG